MVNPYTKEKEIGGVKYKCQFNGMSAALRAIDQSYVVVEGQPVNSIEKLAAYLFENVIVEPANLSIDDFEDFGELNEVIAFAREVMQGEFRDKQDKKTASTEGKG